MDLQNQDELHRLQEYFSLPFSSVISASRISKQAEDELGETPEKVQIGLDVLKEFINRKAIRCNTSDEFLLKFLRVKKFRYQDSMNMLADFTKNVKKIHDKLGFIDSASVKRALKKCSAGILPYRDSDGRPIIYFRLGMTLDQGLSPEETIKTMLCSLLHIMDQNSSQAFGMSILLDSQHACVKEIPPTIELARLFVHILKGTPVRIHRIDIINACTIFRICYYAVIPFVPRKILQKVTIYNDMESIQQHYHKSMLPAEFGGEAGPLCNEHWIDAVDEAIMKIQLLQRTALENNCNEK